MKKLTNEIVDQRLVDRNKWRYKIMYIAKFQDKSGYWTNVDNVSLDDGIRFLNQQIKTHTNYENAIVKNQETNQEIFSYRTVK